MQLEHVNTEVFTPVIEAIPLEVAGNRMRACQQEVARLLQRHPVRFGIASGNVGQPHVVVVRQVEDGAVHIEHERFALAQRGFGFEDHCYILRGPPRD